MWILVALKFDVFTPPFRKTSLTDFFLEKIRIQYSGVTRTAFLFLRKLLF